MISYGFILTSLIVILTPGTGVIYTVSIAISGNKRDSITAAFGCTAGIIPHLITSMIGLSAIFYASSILFKIIKIIGVAYLFYLGIGMIRNKSNIQITEGIKENNKVKIFLKGILINLLNPKLSLFFFSFLPQFIDSIYKSYLPQIILLGAFFMIMTLIIFILYGLLANYFKQLILNSAVIANRIQQSFGLLFIGLAAKLALSDD